MQSTVHIPKHLVPVRMGLVDGSTTYGTVHVRQGQRILDMLLDSRAFFPLMSTKGMSLVNKRNVVKMDVLTMEEIREKEEYFPELNHRYLESNAW